MEFSIELWAFIYSYNKSPNNFKDIQLEWDKHNKIYIFNDNSALKVRCYPLFDISNSGLYADTKIQSISFYKWNYIRCGTNLLTKKYYLETVQADLSTVEAYPDYDALTATIFRIFRSSDAYTNFEYIFLRDIKLWQQYNFIYVDTQYLTLKDYTKFPGLVRYFKNLYKDIDSKLLFIEEITGTQINVVRKIDYVGYNIVDPNNEGITSLIEFCELGEIYDQTTQTCVPQIVPQCEYVANVLNGCVTCQNQIVFLHQVDGGCYDECPEYYFNNEHINQCRPCHDTCYRCTDRFYNNCTECTGALYWYQDEKTCIPNCESVGLTKSLTRPNICVTFDADASLVNVDSLTPIDITTFTYIEAVVIGATSTGYTTEWRFEVDQTNALNQELGFTDTISAGSTPFIGDVTDLNTPLDNTFFKLEHKYVISLDIIKENMGEKVVVTKSWTLTMNAPPKNGYIKIIPSIGLLNTTTYVITAYDWEDENTVYADLKYYFYYIEKNTNTKIPLSTGFSTNNEVYSNFTVRFYQLESTQIDIFCLVQDQYLAETETSATMTVVNQVGSSLYDLTQVLSNYDLNAGIPDLKYLSRSEFLKSVAINPYREVQPNQYYTTYENSLDGSIVNKVDPNCVDNYCNSNGECGLIDVTIACYCDLGYVGNNCNVDKNGYSKLAYYYQEMFDRLMDVLTGINTINQIQFNSMYNIFFAAQTFMQDTTFFTVNLQSYLSFLMTHGTPLIMTQIDKLMDLYDFFYRYYYIKMNQSKLSNKIGSNSPERNFTLLLSQQKDYETAYTNFIGYMTTVTKYLINHYKTDYTYKTDRLHYYLLKIDETFNDTSFFSTFPDDYLPYVEFMGCLKEKKSSFSYWLLYLQYLQYPFSYDSVLYPNLTSPYITVQLYDNSGSEVSITKCETTPVKLYFPFNSYNYLPYINAQQDLFDPKNYKLADDPIFRDPIHIEDNGYISEDTVQDRITKFYRHNNFSGLYYIPTSKSFSPSGIVYETYTTNNNYIIFNSEHIASFTTMLIPNEVEFVVDGRFFYLKKHMIFKYWPNYQTNEAFICIMLFLGLFLFSCLIYWLYDFNFFSQKSLLEFLKKEIVRVHLPYLIQNNVNINELIPKYTPTLDKKKEIKHMFDDVDFNDDSKSNDNQINDSDNEGNNQLKLNNNIENDDGYNSNNNSDFNSNKGDNDAPTEKINNIAPITKYSDTVDNLSTVMNKYQTTKEGGKHKKKNNYFLDIEKTRPNLISLKKFHNSAAVVAAGDLPENLENEEEDRAKTLEAYASLNISTGSFISWNILHRHLIINPILHISLFNPRWKKFFVLTTQLYISMLIISILLTKDETIDTKNVGGMLKIGVLTAFVGNIIMYFLTFFFVSSNYQRRRLFHLVVHGEQLNVIKGFEKIQRNNNCWTAIGICICLLFWGVNFYVSIAFTAVWSVQSTAWLITFILCVFFELTIFEPLIEVIIGGFFKLRKKTECVRNFGEWLNRVRCYRTLWP